MRWVSILVLASCARGPTPIERLRRQVEDVTARAHAVMAEAHSDAELRAARVTLVDLQLELADLSDRISQLQSRP